MKDIIILVFCVFFCVAYGSPYTSSNQSGKPGSCKETVSAFLPDPKTKCCGLNGLETEKVIGGPNAKLTEYPWLALIEFEKEGTKEIKTLCSGNLISGKYVLTAAHCVFGPAIKSYGKPKNVRLGEYDISNDGPDCVNQGPGFQDCDDGITSIPIEKIIPHPEYTPRDKEHKHDIALIRMTQLAPYTDFIAPICLPTIDFGIRNDESLHLIKTGWDLVKSNNNSIKRRFTLPFVKKDVCAPHFKKLGVNLEKGHICAGGENVEDLCKGDSGNPLMYENGNIHELVGFASFGLAVCPSAAPTVYTNVYEYKDWIKNTIVA